MVKSQFIDLFVANIAYDMPYWFKKKGYFQQPVLWVKKKTPF